MASKNEKIISAAGLRAGQVLAPGYGEGLPEVHVGDLKHDMTPADAVPVSEGRNIKLREIMQDIAARGRAGLLQDRLIYQDQPQQEVVEEEPVQLTSNPHRKQSIDRAMQRQTESEAMLDEPMFDDTQKSLREASDKMRARSFADKSAAFNSDQMSVSEMMDRDDALANGAKKRAKRQKGASATRNGTSAEDDVEVPKTLAVKQEVVQKQEIKKADASKAKEAAFDPTLDTGISPKYNMPVKANEGSLGLQRVEHHTMSKADRLAALDARLGGIVAKVQKNQAEAEKE